MIGRKKLPYRREHEVYEFDLDGVRYVGGISRFTDGSVGEVFFHGAGKSGSAAERLAHDAAVAASLALQGGVTVPELQHSLVKLKDGSSAGPLGALLARAMQAS